MGIDPPTVAAAKRHLIQANRIFPLTNPGIVSIPLGFLAAILGDALHARAERRSAIHRTRVRANTGLGAEKATAH